MRLVCVTLLIATASLLAGQEKAATDAGKPPDSTQPAQHDYRFEVASIRPGTPPGPTMLRPGQALPPPAYTPGRYRETLSLSILALKAFGLTMGDYHLVRPSWMDSAWFTINATIPEGATKADLPIMIRHLLEDRFGLVFHHETRHMAGYELIVARSGPKIAKWAGPAPDVPRTAGSTVEGNGGDAHFTKDAGSAQLYTSTHSEWRGRNKTMKGLADDLAQKVGEPVVDATGLEGGYDYTLLWSEPPPEAGDGSLPDPPKYPALPDALQEQLGLRLQPAKDVPVDIVVLDSANKVPTEN